MAFTAYGTGYPKLQWEYKIGAGAWSLSGAYAFDTDDRGLKLSPMHPIRVLECPVIELEDGSTREFLKGWRLRWEMSVKGPENNDLYTLFYNNLLDWLASASGATQKRILFWPHYDKSGYSYSVRITMMTEQYLGDKWPLGYEMKIVFETIDIESTVPYYM